MEWNMTENFSMGWNGGFLVWNVNKMEKNCHYGIRENRLPFHTMTFRQHKSNKIACKVHLRVFFFFTQYNQLFHTEQGCGSG